MTTRLPSSPSGQVKRLIQNSLSAAFKVGEVEKEGGEAGWGKGEGKEKRGEGRREERRRLSH